MKSVSRLSTVGKAVSGQTTSSGRMKPPGWVSESDKPLMSRSVNSGYAARQISVSSREMGEWSFTLGWTTPTGSGVPPVSGRRRVS